MILSTSDRIEGREMETIGIVRGNAARARGVGYDITAGIRNVFGGSVPEYTKLMTETRDEATANMIQNAEAVGADAIVAVRYSTSTIASGVSEILAFGTAVKLR